MQRIFIPSFGQDLRIEADWRFRTLDHYCNEAFVEAYQQAPTYRKYAIDAFLPAGTVLRVTSVSVLNSPYKRSKVTLRIQSCENPDLLPKSKGGTHFGSVSVSVELDHINTLTASIYSEKE